MYTDYITIFDSIIIEVIASNVAVTSISRVQIKKEGNKNHITKLMIEEIRQYVKGNLKKFTAPISYSGTIFQNKVWQALLDITYGETVTYSSIAEKIENSKACRAVGTAIGKNPLLFVIPCHRVVGKSTLGGFSAGLDLKQKLLILEKEGANF